MPNRSNSPPPQGTRYRLRSVADAHLPTSREAEGGPGDATDPPASFSIAGFDGHVTHALAPSAPSGVIFQPFQPKAEPKASPRGGGRFSPGDGGGKGVSPRLNGGAAALGRSMAASGRVAEGKPSGNRRWKVGIFLHALLRLISKENKSVRSSQHLVPTP